MSVETGLYGIAVLAMLLVMRVPVALAMISVSFGGTALLLGFTPARGMITPPPHSFLAPRTMSEVPMFLLMGFISFHAGLTTNLFDAAKAILGRVPGGLAISSIFACTGFAAVSGSSIACAAAMGRIAIPEMVNAGYRPSFAAGALAAGGTIRALIPPSILMIVYGVFAETSITQIFVGGIGVGLLTALSYCSVVLAICWLRPDIVPRTLAAVTTEGGRRAAILRIWPLAILVVLVFGGLFSGYFTATEAGAVGAGGAFVLSAITGRLSMQVVRVSLLETLTTCASLFIIGIGASMFTRFLGVTGLSSFIGTFVAGADLGYVELMTIIVVIYLILGMFMEPFGALLVTLPVLLPVLKSEGISLVWFGVLVVKLLEIGMITPPVGLNVFVIKNVASRYVTVVQVFKGVTPFMLADLAVVILTIAFPALVLSLPQLFF